MTATTNRDDAPGEGRSRDPVFVRTAKGNATARSPDANLPRMVKTLLIAVDGRTSVSMFQQLLPNFGDVSALFEALEGGGFVEVAMAAPAGKATAGAPSRVVSLAARQRPEASGGFAAPSTMQPPESRSADPTTSRWFDATQNFSAPQSMQPRQSTLEETHSRHSSILSGERDFARNANAQLSGGSMSGHRSAVTETARVRDARTLMADFMFENLPDVAMEAVLALERLETTEQILSNLPEYQRLIGTTGRKGMEHLMAIRKALSI
jgi:hypothetical protein